jgi:hypothetical protein
VERFVIGHNADPSNWRERLEVLAPQCLEIFVPARHASPEGLDEVENAFGGIAAHPAAKEIEFLSCHFPWGETLDGYSSYELVDDQYFYSFERIATAFHKLFTRLGLPPERSALNFHNLYEFPHPLLKRLRQQKKLRALRDVFLKHALDQTLAAKRLLEIFELPLALVNENNPPIGAGDRMSIIDVIPRDLAERASQLNIGTCLDLSHFFMTKFYFDLPPKERPDFPYLEQELESDPDFFPDFEFFLNAVEPLYYHVSDTRRPGTDRSFEGVAIGTGDTPWINVLTVLGQYAFHRSEKLYLIIELKGGYTAEGIRQCQESERVLRGYIEDCFSSGFLEALEEKDGPS